MSHQITRHSCLLAMILMMLAPGCDRTPEPAAPTPVPATVESERHVALDGQPNFRDLGGYRTQDGRSVKKGLGELELGVRELGSELE